MTTNPFDQFDEVIKPKTVVNPFDQFDDKPEEEGEEEITRQNQSYLKETISNIPQSAFQALKDTASVVTNPGETIAGLFGLVFGTIEKLIPGGPDLNVRFADAAIDHLRDRYGSMDNLKETIKKDPVGVVLDLSTVLLPVGWGVTKVGGKISKMGKVSTDPLKIGMTQEIGNVVEDLGKVATTASNILDPAILAGKVAGSKTVRAITPGFVKKFVPSSRKQLVGEVFDIDVKSSDKLKNAEKLVEKAIKKRLLPTKEGRKKTIEMIDGFQDQINARIDKIEPTTDPISIKTIKEHMNSFKELKVFKKDKQRITEIVDDFLDSQPKFKTHADAKKTIDDLFLEVKTSMTSTDASIALDILTKELNDSVNLKTFTNIERQTIEELRTGITNELERVLGDSFKEAKGRSIDPLNELKNLIDKRLNDTGGDLSSFAGGMAQVLGKAATGVSTPFDLWKFAGNIVPDLRIHMLKAVNKLESKGIPIDSKTYLNIAKFDRMLGSMGLEKVLYDEPEQVEGWNIAIPSQPEFLPSNIPFEAGDFDKSKNIKAYKFRTNKSKVENLYTDLSDEDLLKQLGQ